MKKLFVVAYVYFFTDTNHQFLHTLEVSESKYLNPESENKHWIKAS